MLRVFKATSPMSVGSWILAAGGAFTTIAAACQTLGVLPRIKLAAEAVSAALGAPQAVYTGTLLADTAIPVWHEARHELPFIFGASSAARAGAAATLFLPAKDAGAARRLTVGGALAANLGSLVMQARLGKLGEPYRKGPAGALNVAAKTCSAAGVALLRRREDRLGAALVLAGELCLRWSVFRAGFQSARDPKYVVEPQRARLAGRS
jgi:hypothetical protein